MIQHSFPTRRSSDLYAALIGDTPLDPEYATALFDRIKAFRAVDHDA